MHLSTKTSQPDTRAPRKRVILAEPRGFRAGVRRAIAMAERALEVYGPPIYVRKQIVHNHYVVGLLERKGARFVESEYDVPEGAVCLFSAHGVPPAVRTAASIRDPQVIDATCPLAQQADPVPAVGSEDSSDSRRMVDVARDTGTPAQLVPDVSGLDSRGRERLDDAWSKVPSDAPAGTLRRTK
ncbi:hypothetical protein [Streptomyces sp. OE57]|uniref:hypothetical protein n=1 Tax=Streptomyces lacaronensis TaxID=3379885 RepID=UPI0039B78F51